MIKTTFEIIDKAIHYSLNFNDIMDSVLRDASAAVRSDSASVTLKRGDAWVVNYAHGFKVNMIGLALTDEQERHAVLAIKTAKPVYVEDTSIDPRVNREHMEQYGVKAVIVVPMMTADEVEGCIYFNYHDGPHVFGDEIKDFAERLAASVSFAITNTKRYEALLSELRRIKINEETIRAQNELLSRQAMLLNLSNEAIFAYEFGGNIIFWNSGAEKMYGFTAEDAIGHKPDNLLKSRFGISKADLGAALRRDGEWTGSITHTCAGGGRIIVETRMQLFSGVSGRRVVLETNRDITERLAMLQAEKDKNEALSKTMQMKDEFISLISHEFVTPLSVINIAIQTMRQLCGSELSPTASEYLNKIQKNSNRQLRLVNNLLDITRAQAGRLKINRTGTDIVNITRMMTDSVALIAENRNIKLTFTTEVPYKIIDIDAEKYERILLNLLSNALKFTPKGKTIDVRVFMKKLAGRQNVCIEVRDTGIGIPEDKLEMIFERFGQVDTALSRRAEGTGIGLTIVKAFTDKLGGKIRLESKLGEGSVFTLMFPAARPPAAQKASQASEAFDERIIQTAAIELSDIY